MTSKTLAELMSAPVITVTRETPTGDVLALMAQKRISAMVVAEEEQPLGIFTERDIVRQRVQNRLHKDSPIGELMTTPLITAPPEMDHREAFQLSVERGIRHLVVVNSIGQLVGIITETDFVRHLGQDYFLSSGDLRTIITRNLVTLTPAQHVIDALNAMSSHRISCILVMEQARPAGILTERDAVRLVHDGTDLEGTALRKVMSHPVNTVQEETSMQDAIWLMQRKSIRRLAVTDPDGQLVGLLTESDLIKGLQAHYTHLLQEMLAQQSAQLERAQKALSEKTILESLLHSPTDMAIIATDRQFHILYCNPAAQHLLDCGGGEAGNRTLLELCAGRLSGSLTFERAIEITLETGACRYEATQEHAGTQHCFECHLSVIRNPESEVTGFMLVAQDITARKQTELQLAQRDILHKTISLIAENLLGADSWKMKIREVLRKLGETVNASRAYLFRNHQGRDGQLLSSRCHEWTAPGIVSQINSPDLQNFHWSVAGVEHWYKRLSHRRPLMENVKQASPAERAVLKVWRTRSILLVPVFAEGEYWGSIGFDECRGPREWSSVELNALQVCARLLGNAIQKQQAATRLHESEWKFHQVVEHIRELFFLFSKAENRFIFLSPVVETLWGRPAAEIYRDPRSALADIHPEDRFRVLRVLGRRYRYTLCNFQDKFEFRILRPDGAVRWLYCSLSCICDAETGDEQITGILDDITQRREAEAMRLAEVEQQRDTLVREVHHRIKNHLQGVINLLHEASTQKPEAAAFIGPVSRQIKSIAIVHGLQSEAKRERITLALLIRAICKAMRQLTNIPIILEIHKRVSGNISVHPDESVPLALIINELLQNAIKHTPEGAEDPQIRVRLENDGPNLRLRLSNSSPPLPAGFDLASGSGLGTGLELVKALLPHEGIRLSLQYSDACMTAELILTPPVVLPGRGGAVT